MAKKRNPNAGNNLITTRIDDISLAEIAEIAKQNGLTKSRVTWRAIKAGLPKVKKDLAKQPGQ